MATFRKRNGKWQVQVRKIGSNALTRTFSSKQDATTWARAEEHRLEVGDLPTLKELKSFTLSDLLDRYEREVIPFKRTDSSEKSMLNVIRRHAMAQKPLSHVSSQDFADFRDKRLNEVKPATVLRQLRVLIHALRVARDEWGLRVPLAEATKLRMPQVLVRHTDRVSDEQIQKLIAAADAQTNPLIGKAIRLAIATGMRRGELLALDWGDVDLNARRLLVRTSKNGRPRVIPLTTFAVSTFQGIGPSEGPVLPLSANAVKLG